ncbi:putative membrane protein YhhN [Aeromicrobium sp. SORGH_AS981]|uniref:lysoplasmalogenase family protein n=1 Tax=Aeromicrobium sp. SORGH_AS_0981 TaxID=3041802 RepID=UPI00285E8D47|nr:lysoplasmalogenase family protein [Aeromicrobium sp. SORGH_AS_0981]MDR6117403.1 putative membrane protein YhhN [Aeromicrobium sp. SORGH_AS_0981]
MHARHGSTGPVARPYVVAFVAVLAVHLVLLAADLAPWDSVTKCLLAPVLVVSVVAERGPRLLVAALVLCLGGDLLLEVDGLFVAGMASFAAAHVCLVTLFVRAGAVRERRPNPLLLVTYLLAGVALVAWAWGGLAADLRPVVPVYAVLLLATAVTWSCVDVLAGVGGALFLVSDGLIALGEAGRVDPGSATVSVAVMALYGAAIALLTAGALRVSADRPASSPVLQQPSAEPLT